MKFSAKNILQQYQGWKWEWKILLSAAVLTLIPIAVTAFWATPGESATERKGAAQMDTYIPKGFVLVPIEVQNYEALDSILGRFALVDLYQGGGPGPDGTAAGSRQHLVARNVRLLRAPQNPSHFAVLVQESEVRHVLGSGAQFTVIVKRPGEGGTEFVRGEGEDSTPHRNIVYEGKHP